eukprot:1114796-Pelagomonas_calceolata.AAC.3
MRFSELQAKHEAINRPSTSPSNKSERNVAQTWVCKPDSRGPFDDAGPVGGHRTRGKGTSKESKRSEWVAWRDASQEVKKFHNAG